MGDEAREVSQSKEAFISLGNDFVFCTLGNKKSLITFKQKSKMITFAFLNDNSGYNGENSLDGMMASFTGGTIE